MGGRTFTNLARWGPRKGGSFWRLRYVVLAMAGATVLSAAGVVFSSGYILDAYVRPRLERAFADSHPGYSLKVASMGCSLRSNRVICRSIKIVSPGGSWTGQIGTVTLSAAAWLGLLAGHREFDRVFEQSSLRVTNVSLNFPKSGYLLTCRQLTASMPKSSVVAEGIELRPAIGDEEFFAARAFRRPRVRLALPRCELSGLNTRQLFRQKRLYAEALQFHDPSLGALFNREKPVNPHPANPLMPREAIARLPLPVAIKAVTVVNGRVEIAERLGVGAEPGVLTFDGVQMSLSGLTDQPASGEVARFQGQAKLMNEGMLQMDLTLPLDSTGLSFHYSGTLGAMNLTSLNSFLMVAGGARLKSGVLREASFESTVNAGHAVGVFRGLYHDLDLAFVDRRTREEKGIVKRVKSFVTDHMVLRDSNLPDKAGMIALGRIDYTRKPEEKFLHFLWFGVRSGVVDLLRISEFVKDPK